MLFVRTNAEMSPQISVRSIVRLNDGLRLEVSAAEGVPQALVSGAPTLNVARSPSAPLQRFWMNYPRPCYTHAPLVAICGSVPALFVDGSSRCQGLRSRRLGSLCRIILVHVSASAPRTILSLVSTRCNEWSMRASATMKTYSLIMRALNQDRTSDLGGTRAQQSWDSTIILIMLATTHHYEPIRPVCRQSPGKKHGTLQVARTYSGTSCIDTEIPSQARRHRPVFPALLATDVAG